MLGTHILKGTEGGKVRTEKESELAWDTHILGRTEGDNLGQEKKVTT
jgi:hypothetical protein